MVKELKMNKTDEIKRLRRELDAVTAEVDRLRASVANWERKEISRAVCCVENEDRAEAAEARLAKAREALRDVLSVSEDRERFVRMGARGWVQAEQIAREALAEIDGSARGYSK